MTGIIIAHRNKKTLGGASGEGLASGGFYSGAMFGVIQLITSLVIICGLIAATQVTWWSSWRPLWSCWSMSVKKYVNVWFMELLQTTFLIYFNSRAEIVNIVTEPCCTLRASVCQGETTLNRSIQKAKHMSSNFSPDSFHCTAAHRRSICNRLIWFKPFVQTSAFTFIGSE